MTEACYRVAAEIDLDAIIYNYKQIRAAVSPGIKIMPVIKADAYGHGAVEIAGALVSAGAEYFAVANVEEAILLRENGITLPVLILGYTLPVQMSGIVRFNLTQTIFSEEMAQILSDEAQKQQKTIRVHIKIDTGMGRIGFYPNSAAINSIKKIHKLPNLKIEGIFTHLSSADEKDKSFTLNQISSFLQFISKLEQSGISIPIKHAANSACIIDLKEGHLNMVRPGLILYGMYPSGDVNRANLLIKPAMSLKTRVILVKDMEPGMPVSYGRTYRTSIQSRIATIPVGYADGYPRKLSSIGRVIINGKYAPIVGRICMDQFMADVTGIPDTKTGDNVILIGSDGNLVITADEIAELTGTINYEIVCGISNRVPRIYKGVSDRIMLLRQ